MLRDTLARLGGDEFVVLVDEVVDVAEPLRVGSRLQQALRDSAGPGAAAAHVTMSIGVALAGRGSAEDLVTVADQAMYRAKANGKNRIEIDQQP